MSGLTQCNYCTLDRLKREAKANNMAITTKSGFQNGTDVWVHPKDETNNLGKDSPYWRCWLMTIPNKCVC